MSAFKDNQRNTWYVKFCYRDWKGDKKWVTKRGFATKREAVQFERDFLAKQSGNLDMTFADFVEVYQRDRNPRIRESTIVMKDNIINTKLIPYFGHRRLRDITTSDVMQWQNEMLAYRDPETGKPYSNSYLKSIHSQLSAIFNHAVRFYKLKENPAAIVGNMGSAKGIQMKFWTKDEYLKFAEAMMDEPLAYYCFQVLYWCGVRVGELLALSLADINFEKKTLCVSKTYQHINGKDIISAPKTERSYRTVNMPDFLVEELKDYVRMQYELNPTDRLFPVSKHYLFYKLRKGAKKADLPQIRIHDLRHPYVKHTTKIFSLRLIFSQAQAYSDARQRTCGAYQCHQEGRNRSPFLPFCNRNKSSSCIPHSNRSWTLYAISMRLSGNT